MFLSINFFLTLRNVHNSDCDAGDEITGSVDFPVVHGHPVEHWEGLLQPF